MRCAAASAASHLARSRQSSSVCGRSEEHTSELQSRSDLVCRLLLEKKKKITVDGLSHIDAPTKTPLGKLGTKAARSKVSSRHSAENPPTDSRFNSVRDHTQVERTDH